MYKLMKDGNSVIRAEDGTCTPFAEGNADYQEYLAWVAQGNEPEPYIEPPPPIQQSITPRQGRIMLSRAGLLDTVKELLANKTGQAGVEARIEFETAAQWERDWPLLLSASSEVGLTNAQVDQMFVDGAKL